MAVVRPRVDAAGGVVNALAAVGQTARVALVALDPARSSELAASLARVAGEVAHHPTPEAAFADLETRHFDALAIDLSGGRREALALVRAALAFQPYVAVVVCGAASPAEALEVIAAGARDAIEGQPRADDLARRIEAELGASRLRRLEDLHRAAWRLLRCASWDECALVTVEEAERVLAPCSARLEPAVEVDVDDGVWAMPVAADPSVALVVEWPLRADARQMRAFAATFVEDVRVAFEAASSRARLEEHITELESERERRSVLETEMVRSERVAAVGMIAAGIAHEVNNPLALVLTNLEVLAARIGPPSELASIVAESLEGARRVRDVVGQLSSFSPRATGARAEAIVDLRRTIEAVGRLALPSIRLRGSLALDLPDAELPVRGSPGQLAQALSGVVLNAAQALGPDGDGHVQVRARAVDGQVTIEIADDGIGVAADALDRVFDPFFTTKEAGQGMGLGLPIAAEIVHAHAGMIELTSAPGAGTVVHITLPLAYAEAAACVEPVAAPAPEARLRVLFVDDEPALLRALARAFAAEMDVTTASSAAALALLRDRASSFDLVVSDFLMPDVGGDALYEIVAKERPDLARNFVVASGARHDERLLAFLERTGVPALAKPFGASELRAVHAELVERRA